MSSAVPLTYYGRLGSLVNHGADAPTTLREEVIRPTDGIQL